MSATGDSGKARQPSIAHEFFSLEAVDFGELKEEVGCCPPWQHRRRTAVRAR